jgi:hypothetical protein
LVLSDFWWSFGGRFVLVFLLGIAADPGFFFINGEVHIKCCPTEGDFHVSSKKNLKEKRLSAMMKEMIKKSSSLPAPGIFMVAQNLQTYLW